MDWLSWIEALGPLKGGKHVKHAFWFGRKSELKMKM